MRGFTGKAGDTQVLNPYDEYKQQKKIRIKDELKAEIEAAKREKKEKEPSEQVINEHIERARKNGSDTVRKILMNTKETFANQTA